MRAKDLVKGNIAYHHTLNQDVWDGDELRVDVRYKLLEIAKRFVEYLEVPDFKLVDVILRGSLVNFNYTQYSDFDLHVVTDFAAIDSDITEPFYMAKKKIWNDEHDITIKGHEVELYVEDKDAKNVSEGTYSVLDNRWLRVPEYRKPSIDDAAVSAKARDLMTQINRAIKAGSVEDIQRLQDKIKTMRQAGLDKGGEFSTENLAFKIVRNKGYLDKLYKNKNSKFDQELSLDEAEETYSVKTDAGEEFPCNDQDHAVNKARSLLSYKKADKVYILKNGKAVYSWQLNSKMQPIAESQAHLDPAVEEFLDGLTPDDVGYDDIGEYRVHYEGFTDQCQDTKEYQDDPEAVFDDVWHDFKRREGDKDPINYGIVGEHDYPIVYSVFRRD